MQNHYQPHVQVRENCLLLFDMPGIPFNHSRNTTGFSKAYSGMVAPGTEKRIRKAIDIFLQLTPNRRIWNPVANVHHDFRLGFVTLTVSDTAKNLTAKEGYSELLAPWLRWAKGQGVKNYIWKAELQQRGQLHYHVTIDEFVHWEKIRNQWNRYQKKAGLLEGFAKRYRHFNPNSTDVHAVRNIKNFEAYLSKYLAKASQNQQATKGKVWDCSQELKRPRFSHELDSHTAQAIENAIAKGAKVVRHDHCTIVQTPRHKTILSPALKAQYHNWIQ